MRIALCFFGIAYGKNDKGDVVDFKKSLPYFNANVIDGNNIDVFLHTWSVDSEKDLVKYFKPKKYITEKQIFFGNPSEKEHSLRSRFFSSKKVIELKKEYEIENNFKYDLVFLSRYDINFFKKVNFNKVELNKFYISNWEEKPSPNSGILDLWFLSNSENIDKFGEIFDIFDEYKKDENYIKTISAHVVCDLHLKRFFKKEDIKDDFLFYQKDWELERFTK